MEPNYGYIAASLTDAELIERIENRQKYMPETIEASIAELQFRKHEFSDEELKFISEDVQALRSNADLVSNRLGFFNREYKNVIVQDPHAPQLYSRIAIYGFSFFMGPLFGSILMAMNLGKLGKTKQALWVVLFGLGLSVLQYFAVSYANTGTGSSVQVLGGLIAAYCIDIIFWRNYIGYSTFYRKRPIWIPIIIAIVFIVIIIAGIIVSGGKSI